MDGIYEGKVVEIKCPYVLSEEHPENDTHIHPNDFDKRELVNKFCKKATGVLISNYFLRFKCTTMETR